MHKSHDLGAWQIAEHEIKRGGALDAEGNWTSHGPLVEEKIKAASGNLQQNSSIASMSN